MLRWSESLDRSGPSLCRGCCDGGGGHHHGTFSEPVKSEGHPKFSTQFPGEYSSDSADEARWRESIQCGKEISQKPSREKAHAFMLWKSIGISRQCDDECHKAGWVGAGIKQSTRRQSRDAPLPTSRCVDHLGGMARRQGDERVLPVLRGSLVLRS